MIKPPYRVPSMDEIANGPRHGYKVCSTFSGCGGSSLGYKMAGFQVLWANEFIPAAQETYEANHPTTILDKRDIRDVTPEDIFEATGLTRGELDLFDGSPPCKDFSMAGSRDWESGKVKKYSDTKQRTDDLFDQFIRLLDGLQPKTFVAENVKGMTVGKAVDVLGAFQRDMFVDQSDTVLDMMMNAGYIVQYRVLNAAQLGVPQARQRIIFVGVRKDLAKEFNLQPSFPKPLNYVYSIRDAIPWISRVADGSDSWLDAGSSPSPTILASDGGRNTSSFDQGLGYVEAEADITKYCTGREWDLLKPGEQSEKYFQLVKADPELPCQTICASHGSGGIASVVHPYEKRKWSIAELKRICGFPDDFLLTGDFKRKWERLGRAVPPVMMKHVAKTVYWDILKKLPKGII
jgi:DNA (cytosine-5)-methyltransferase 1